MTHWLTAPAAILSRVVTRARLWRCSAVGRGVRAPGRVWVHGGGDVRIGDDVLLDGRVASIELHADEGALIEIGAGSVLAGGVSIEAQQSVRVGPGCRLGAFAKVLDNHFHPTRGDRHRRPDSEPVVLGQGVTVGPRAILLPGAQLLDGAQIGAGAVVSRRVAPGAVVGAPPPRVSAGDEDDARRDEAPGTA